MFCVGRRDLWQEIILLCIDRGMYGDGSILVGWFVSGRLFMYADVVMRC